MKTPNMQPLPGQNIVSPVLFVNFEAGHAAIMDAADDRFSMALIVADLIQCASHLDPGASDVSEVCRVLHMLIREGAAMASAAYDLATDAGKTTEHAE